MASNESVRTGAGGDADERCCRCCCCCDLGTGAKNGIAALDKGACAHRGALSGPRISEVAAEG